MKAVLSMMRCLTGSVFSDEADRIAGRFISEQSSRCFICTIAGILLTVNFADADADTEGTKDSGRYKDMIL